MKYKKKYKKKKTLNRWKIISIISSIIFSILFTSSYIYDNIIKINNFTLVNILSLFFSSIFLFMLSFLCFMCIFKIINEYYT